MSVLCCNESGDHQSSRRFQPLRRLCRRRSRPHCFRLPEGRPLPRLRPIDLSIANENLWLEADSLGLGGVWLRIAPLEDRMHAVEQILSMPPTLRAFAIFALGHPAESRPRQDRFDESRIHLVP